ncbi:MAG: hypothetical protein J6C64_06090 [Lachnospiraceae bacterium]|nr:hypothetical protein [Lachnospiraceae bacterium]
MLFEAETDSLDMAAYQKMIDNVVKCLQRFLIYKLKENCNHILSRAGV